MGNLPFTVAQFLSVFTTYNEAIWPAQLIAYALGISAVGALWLYPARSKTLILSVLVIMWAWNGIGYHFLFFSRINPLATVFAAVFVLQAVALAASAIAKNGVRFELDRSVRTAAAITCIIYAMLIYPVLGLLAGHGFTNGPTFGVAPCPTTIFTIGMLLAARGKLISWLAVIPVLWAMVGLAAAVQLGIPEDLGLPVAALMLAAALVFGEPAAVGSPVQAVQN